jgi:hypothetical protein
MNFRGGEFSTGQMGNFHPPLTRIPCRPSAAASSKVSESRKSPIVIGELLLSAGVFLLPSKQLP